MPLQIYEGHPHLLAQFLGRQPSVPQVRGHGVSAMDTASSSQPPRYPPPTGQPTSGDPAFHPRPDTTGRQHAAVMGQQPCQGYAPLLSKHQHSVPAGAHQPPELELRRSLTRHPSTTSSNEQGYFPGQGGPFGQGYPGANTTHAQSPQSPFDTTHPHIHGSPPPATFSTPAPINPHSRLPLPPQPSASHLPPYEWPPCLQPVPVPYHSSPPHLQGDPGHDGAAASPEQPTLSGTVSSLHSMASLETWSDRTSCSGGAAVQTYHTAFAGPPQAQLPVPPPQHHAAHTADPRVFHASHARTHPPPPRCHAPNITSVMPRVCSRQRAPQQSAACTRFR